MADDETTDVATAHAALRSGQWAQARDSYLAVLRDGPDPAAFVGLSQACWWLDDGAACVEAREQAYRAYRDRGDGRGAARAAADLAYDSLLFGQGASVARGWLARARELLDPTAETEEHGWLAVREAELALAVEHDTAAALAAATRAEALGERLGVADLRFVGLALSGLALTSGGDAARGMNALDAAVAAATAGDVDDVMWMGKICCWMIVACQETQDLGRADDWCRRVEVICERRQLTPLFSVCRIQYSSILVARGTWPEAERTLVGVLDQFAQSRRQTRVDAIVQLGELRRRQGRLAEADELLSQAEFHPVAVAGRSLIRLARGDAAAAWATVRALLPTIPSSNRLARARVLLPAVITAAAAGDVGAAQAAAEELRATASAVGTDPLLGLAAVAAATVAPDDGQALWREAVRRFHDSGLRFDEAESRLGLATALLASGDHIAAVEQLTTATHQLRELGAALDHADRLARTAALAGTTGAGAPGAGGPLTPRETEVMRLVAEGMSNPQIAAALVVSEHTVHRHVANILTKLDQPTRAAATAYAVGHGLV
jgi:ATP/maltotriose-dependent transcriptional regulator MalT